MGLFHQDRIGINNRHRSVTGVFRTLCISFVQGENNGQVNGTDLLKFLLLTQTVNGEAEML